MFSYNDYMWFSKNNKYATGVEDEYVYKPTQPEKDEREKRQIQIKKFFTKVGAQLMEAGEITDLEIRQRSDVHAFFTSASNSNEIWHFQAYPGLSTDTNITLNVRTMDARIMSQLRVEAANKGEDIIGNEHEAVVGPTLFRIGVPYEIDSLNEVLEAFVSNLHKIDPQYE